MILEQLLLIRTGTYDDMYVRPYHMDAKPHLVAALADQTQGGQKTEAANLAGIAGQILAPVSAPLGSVGIVAGWGQERCRFLMRVRHEGMGGEGQIQYLTGYTDYDGINEFTGTVDPKMRFFINNTITTRVFNSWGAGGALVPQLRVKEASQLLVGNVVTDFRKMENSMFTMRPEDVFAQIGAAHEDPSLGPVRDLRPAFHTTPLRLSRRTNGSATEYLSTMLGTYRTAVRSQDNAIHDWTGLANHMSGVVRESTPMADPFLGDMIRFGTSLTEGNSFEYGELLNIAQFTDMNTKIVNLSLKEKAERPTRSLGDQSTISSPWLSQDWEPQIATIASHSIMALMSEVMLTMINFHLTNRNVGGRPSMDVPVALSFVQGKDLRDDIMTLVQRTIAGPFRDLTRNGSVDMSISGTLDMLGNSRLIIQYQDRQPVVFDNPTFADGLTSPVMAYSHENINNLATDMDTLANQLSMDLSAEAYAPEPTYHANPLSAVGPSTPVGTGGGYSGPAI